MKTLLAIFLVLMSVMKAANAEEVIFYLGQSSNEWTFKITGKGRSLIGDTLIYTKIDTLKIVNNPKHNKYKKIDFVEIGYGYLNSNGRWDIQHVGARKPFNENIGPGEWMTINNLGAELQISETPPKDYWIVLIVGTNEKSTVYAHSRKDIFQHN
ncbi:hypothetical protein [Pseudomonas sp.]|uniref:hypothetical protein n=1 Tax=Pseudomonas sp. TaxID=306 RepID=UPI00257E5C3A|nr:hypothetical protein [Pseudomonas sp.]